MSAAVHLVEKAAEELIHAANQALDKALPMEIAEIVKHHSFAAAAAGVAAGWVPGAGGVAAAGLSAGAIWTMYGRINTRINLPLTENIVKSLATGVATNLASYVVAGLVVSTVFSLVPGLGSISASIVVGGTCYALTVASGYVYLKTLTHLFRRGVDPTTLDADELKQEAKDVAAAENLREVIDSAKSDYKASKERE